MAKRKKASPASDFVDLDSPRFKPRRTLDHVAQEYRDMGHPDVATELTRKLTPLGRRCVLSESRRTRVYPRQENA